MRAAAILIALVAMLLASGCGGEERQARSVAVEQLAALCEAARADIESLGLPSEIGIEVMKPWAARGKRLATDVGRIKGASDAERTQLRELERELAEYYAGLSVGYTTYKQTSSREMYTAIVERAEAFLTAADKRATALGAPECTARPFDVS
jgi:hypothetical protein